MEKLGQIFRANMGFNPTHGSSDGELHPALSRRFKGMKNTDPSDKKEKALLVCIYQEIYSCALSLDAAPHDITTAWLQVLAFFCMQSCEYSEVSGERRTKSPQQAHQSRLMPDISNANFSFCYFLVQKKDVRDDTFTYQKSNDSIEDKILCPVRASSKLVKKIYSLSIPKEKIPDLQINTVVKNGVNNYPSNNDTRMHLIGSSIFRER
jgi:hypothetical protein